MEVGDIVRSHYGGAGLEDAIFGALEKAGVAQGALTVEDLAPLDQLHAGGLPATAYLLDQLDLSRQTWLLDVGSGIGGPARVAAHRYSCPVVGVDLSPDFVRVARLLTDRVGLSMSVEHLVAAGDRLDLDDALFDRAMMIHVGMNIPDKAAVFAEVRRVLRPGGLFGLFEQMQVGDSPPRYPLPWAEDEKSSFVVSPQAYTEDLEAAGFVFERTESRTRAIRAKTAASRSSARQQSSGPAFNSGSATTS